LEKEDTGAKGSCQGYKFSLVSLIARKLELGGLALQLAALEARAAARNLIILVNLNNSCSELFLIQLNLL